MNRQCLHDDLEVIDLMRLTSGLAARLGLDLADRLDAVLRPKADDTADGAHPAALLAHLAGRHGESRGPAVVLFLFFFFTSPPSNARRALFACGPADAATPPHRRPRSPQGHVGGDRRPSSPPPNAPPRALRRGPVGGRPAFARARARTHRPIRVVTAASQRRRRVATGLRRQPTSARGGGDVPSLAPVRS